MAHKILFYDPATAIGFSVSVSCLVSCTLYIVHCTNIMFATSTLKLQGNEPSLKPKFSKQKWEIIPSVAETEVKCSKDCKISL